MRTHGHRPRQTSLHFRASTKHARHLHHPVVSEPLELRRLFAVLTVNTAGDSPTGMTLTLRNAIDVVNGTVAMGTLSVAQQAQIDTTQPLGANDTIHFDIPSTGVQTISPATDLPSIDRPMTIDGYSQPGAAPASATVPATILIQLSGAGGALDGLDLQAPGVTLKGLDLERFAATQISISASSDHDQIIGNYIGTNAAGVASAPPSTAGISVGAPATTIGGTSPADRNIISGSELGIELGTGTNGSVIEGNYIGTDATGAAPAGDSSIGIDFLGGQNVTVGGAGSGARNVISGNVQDGIYFEPRSDDNLQGTVVEGNYIGTDVTGSAQVSNGTGIYFEAGRNVIIGGTDSGARNVISGNDGDGIEFAPMSAASFLGTVVEGNYIGTDASGAVGLGDLNGIEIIAITEHGGSTNTFVAIGGTGNGMGNVISGNGSGINFDGSGAGTNALQGNLIGVNAAGTAPVPNLVGVYVESNENLIGGTGIDAGNTISGNTDSGMVIRASGTVVQQNKIGVLADGVTAAPNGDDGIIIGSGTDNTIGDDVDGVDPGAANIIANNGEAGIEIEASDTALAVHNTLRLNSIYNNGGLGIDLITASDTSDNTGVTPNDPGDVDSGPNDQQNFPIISSATLSTNSVTVTGTLNSLPNSSFLLDFYASGAPDPSGNGEGQQYLGSVTVSTNASGDATFNNAFTLGNGFGDYITATATRKASSATDDTSEFSAAVKATTATPTPPNPPNPPTTPPSPLPPSYASMLPGLKTTLQALQITAKAASSDAAIKSQLTADARQLSSAAALVKKQTAFAAQYNKETSLIAALQIQLAAQTNATVKAKLQKKINADTAAQTRILNQDKAVAGAALAVLNAVSASETTLQGELAGA